MWTEVSKFFHGTKAVLDNQFYFYNCTKIFSLNKETPSFEFDQQIFHNVAKLPN